MGSHLWRPSSPLEVVYFASVDWGYTWQRAQQLAARLARHGRVLYVDPLGLRAPRLGDWRRLARRLREAAGGGDVAAPASLDVHRPVAYWPFPSSAGAHRVNGRLLFRAADAWLRRGSGRAPLVWAGVPSPAVWEAVRRLRAVWPSARLVYDCIDDVAAFGAGRPWVAETEAALVSAADIVWAASARLLSRLRAMNPAAQLLPNAAEVAHFRTAVTMELPLPDDLGHVPPPRVAYVGEIAPWVDLDLIGEVADAHPHASVVLIGPVHDDGRVRTLARRRNVYALGRRPYSDLPRYLRHMQVCLVPFLRTRLTEAASPIKVYEYLAAGRAVISTPLPEVEPFGDVVTIAERAAFGAAVGNALASERNDADAEMRRTLRVSAHDWDHRAAEVLRALRTPQTRPGVEAAAVVRSAAGGRRS